MHRERRAPEHREHVGAEEPERRQHRGVGDRHFRREPLAAAQPRLEDEVAHEPLGRGEGARLGLELLDRLPQVARPRLCYSSSQGEVELV